ncbi:MAG: iron-containing alcohol dehydrogenase, partial [Bacillales bacterium]|nr:iron-containing alcohol dehydrogenase [Bacillales bacterium]
FIITLGPFSEQLIEITEKSYFSHLLFTFVNNEIYTSSNYIYSFYKCREYIDDDFIVLHGDLVFDRKLIEQILKNKEQNICLINRKLSLPEKDFKGKIIDNKLVEVGINIFDSHCYAFQPLYKLSKKTINKWLDRIIEFVEVRKNVEVYAENALNEITNETVIVPFSYEKYYIDEIDNLVDYERVKKEIKKYDYREQRIYKGFNSFSKICNRYKNPLIVLDNFLMKNYELQKVLKIHFSHFTIFPVFSSNPKIEDIVKGEKEYLQNNCDSIIAIGGGSAMDVGKAIKLMLLTKDRSLETTKIEKYYYIPLLAIPTTAGTGSESTRFAVVYKDNEKMSLSQDEILPTDVIFEIGLLKTLPQEVKVNTLFDALVQSIESIWSINATKESQQYAKKAIRLISKNIDIYIKNNEAIEIMQKAANLSGKAINISQTTAAHALSYKLTSLFGIPHGKAVAMCLPECWKLLINAESKNKRIHLSLSKLNDAFLCKNFFDSFFYFVKLSNKYLSSTELIISDNVIDLLTNSVNNNRLINFPLELDVFTISHIYESLRNK